MPSCNLLKRHCGLTEKRLSFFYFTVYFYHLFGIEKNWYKQALEYYTQLKKNSTLGGRSLGNYGKLNKGGSNNALIRGHYGGMKDVTTFKNHEGLKEKENSNDDPPKKPGKSENRTDELWTPNWDKSTQKAEPKTTPPLKNGFQLIFPHW